MDQEYRIPSLTPTWLLSLVAIATAGCATPYQPTEGFGLLKLEGGHTEMQTSPTAWFIAFERNEKLSNERAREYCILRASEICLDNGFTHFVLIEEKADIRRERSHFIKPHRIEPNPEYGGRVKYTKAKWVWKETEFYKIHIKCSYTEEEDSLNASDIYRSLAKLYRVKLDS